MSPDPPRVPYPLVQSWSSQLRDKTSPFVQRLPKLELHLHIEGTLTPSLRFDFARRNNVPLRSARLQKIFNTPVELEEAYRLLETTSVKGPGLSAFFEAYYGGLECLITELDFYDLGMAYFKSASAAGVKYCEAMFDIQAHTRRGIAISTVMSGLHRARLDAEIIDVKVQYIMCILRDLPVEDAMKHYENVALKYRDMIVGIGLDGNEFNHPPSLFTDLFSRAKADGFRTTAHSDVAQPAALQHIEQILCQPLQLDRIDHGLDAASSPELMKMIIQRGPEFGLTICPWAYVRHCTERVLFGSIRRFMEEGVRISVSSDSPAYVESHWVVENLALLQLKEGLGDEELVLLQKNAVEMCWASEEVKKKMLEEIEDFWEDWKADSGHDRFD